MTFAPVRGSEADRKRRASDARAGELERLLRAITMEKQEAERTIEHLQVRVTRAEDAVIEKREREKRAAAADPCWVVWCTNLSDPDDREGLCARCRGNVDSWRRSA